MKVVHHSYTSLRSMLHWVSVTYLNIRKTISVGCRPSEEEDLQPTPSRDDLGLIRPSSSLQAYMAWE